MKKILFTIALCLLISNILMAQPSGGPYGPVQKKYELPKVSGTIYYVSPDGKNEAKGTSLKAPTTLEVAIANVKTGDAIIMRGGTYRTGDLYLNQSIVMQPFEDEIPIIKGTYLAKNWEPVDQRYTTGTQFFKIKWDRLFPSKPDDWWRKEQRGRETPMHRFNNDMVFINGRFLQSAGWLGELNEDNFFIDYESEQIYIATDPTDKLVEITAFNRGLVITSNEVNGKKADGKGPVIKGITFSQYAFHVINIEGYYPDGVSKESEHGKDVVGTTFENCLISYGGRVGAFVLGDNLTIKNCKFTDTSTEGLYIVASSDVLLEKNIFTRNNIENITGYYPAAVKIFNQTHRVTCNDNLVIDLPNSNGIWYDVGNEDGVFTNNWLENVGYYNNEFSGGSVWPSRNAFFFEISKRAIVAGNVFVNNDHGLLILNSSDVKIYNNTFINSMAVFGRDRRGENTDHFGWHVTTGPGVDERTGHEFANNLIVGGNDFGRPLLFIWQLPDLCEQLNVSALSKLDNNVYVKLNENNAPLIWMAQKINNNCLSQFSDSKELFQAKKEYASKSISLINYKGPLFKSIELKNFELTDGFNKKSIAVDLPDSIKKLVGKNASKPYIGAYSDK